MGKGRVIWLNGVSSSGKSTLCAALRDRAARPLFCVAQETFTNVISPWLSGRYSGEEGAALWYDSVAAMYAVIRLYADLGHDVVVDHIVLDQADGAEQALFLECARAMRGYPVLLVRVDCRPEELARREAERGDRPPGSAAEQLGMGLFPGDGYDLTVDTSADAPGRCAEAILSALERGEFAAFARPGGEA